MEEKTLNPEFEKLEQHLGSVLKPMTPRAEFVNSLYACLVEPSPVTLRSPKLRAPLWIILGVISGIVLILGWVFGPFKRPRLVKSTGEFVDSNKAAQKVSLPISPASAGLVV
jgi:hypothetical protein